MRQKSLVATAAVALLAGTVFASAQGMPKQSPGGGAMERGGAQGQEHSPGAAQNQGEEGKGQRNRAQGQQKEPKGTVGQGQHSEPKAQGSEPKMQRGQGKQPSTTGQGQQSEPKGHESEPKTQRSQQHQQGQEPKTSGQGQQGAPKAQQKSEPKAQQKSEPSTQGQRTGAGGAVTLTTEQRTHIRETVLRGGNAPRVSKVNFSISVGTAVPRSVKVVTVPTVIVDIHPEWRGFLYFVYEEEIIIVDRNHHIVAILAV